MAFATGFTEEVKNQSDIVRVISDYVSLKKRGKNYVANCPFHNEKTPSFNVSPAKQIFHCFGCGTGGDVFTFVMAMEHCDFAEAVRIVAGKSGIPVIELETQPKSKEEREELLRVNLLAAEFFQEQLRLGPEGERAYSYLTSRGLSARSIAEFRLGYAPDRWDALCNYLKERSVPAALIERSGLVTLRESGGHYDRFRGRCIFPITDAQGRIVAFGGRAMGDSEPKYLNSPETALYTKGRQLYGLSLAREAIRKQGFVILVEGYFDFCIPYQNGIQNIVASLGTALTDHQVRLLARYMDQPRIVVNFDPDSAGVSATKRSLEMLLEQGFKVNVLTLPNGEDPDSFVRKNGAAAYKQMLKKSLPYLEYLLGQALKEHDVTRPGGKVEALNALLPFLAKIPDRIERAEYADMLADRLKLEGKIVREELKKAAAGKQHRLNPQRVSITAQLLPAERQLLELLLADETLRKRVMQDLDTSLTTNLATEPIFVAMKELLSESLKIDFTNLKNRLEEYAGEQSRFCGGQLSELVIAASEIDTSDPEALQTRAHQAIAALRRTSLEHQMAAVQIEINEAQKSGNSVKVTELSLKKLDLWRQLSQHF